MRTMRGARAPFARRRTPIVAATIATAEPLERRAMFSATTNDPSLANQYALTHAAVTDAWDTTTGSAATVVADIDSGADYTHQDLYENVWINRAEIPDAVRSSLVDTDGDGVISFYDLNDAGNLARMTDVNHNGYIDAGDLLSKVSEGGWADEVNGRSNADDVYTDDIVGWDFAENDNNPFDDGVENAGHGTHTAGIIGAVGNNGVGISGVMQRVSMMLVRIFGDDGNGTTMANVAAAVRYTADNAARVANASWGGREGFNGDELYSAIQYAGTKGELFVTAAGNDGQNLDSPFADDFPAEYDLDNIIVVGAADVSGELAYYSDYGSSKVDVIAPGSDVLSTLPGNGYGVMSGTSMATPMVTGAVALMLTADRSLTPAQVKQRLIDGSDETAALSGSSLSNGLLNVNNALLARAGARLPTDGNPDDPTDPVDPVEPTPGIPDLPPLPIAPPGFVFFPPGGGVIIIGPGDTGIGTITVGRGVLFGDDVAWMA
jgi:subtilisin family serine protease